MVHALQEAWQVGKAAHPRESIELPFTRGVLDVRPRPGDPTISARLANGRQIRCGPLRYTGTEIDQHTSAEQAVQQALREGWFTLAAKRNFEWIDDYDSVGELLTAVEEEWVSRTVEEDVALRLIRVMDDAEQAARPLIGQRIGIRLYHKIDR